MKILYTAFLLGFYVCTLAGCNTVGGMGKDIEKGGEALQKASD